VDGGFEGWKRVMICDECQSLYEEVGDRVRASSVFEKVRRNDDALRCRGKHAESEVYYIAEVSEAHDLVWVALETPDRWLSESIEADLMFKGDKIEELLEEELVDQGFEGSLPVEHFRNEEKRFVFRSPVFLPASEKLDGEGMVDRVTQVLLAYEAAFRQLGNMVPQDEQV